MFPGRGDSGPSTTSHFQSSIKQSADVLRTHEPGQCLVSLCGALCIFEDFQLQTRKTFHIVSKNTISRIFSSRPEFSRIGGDNSKTQKTHFQSCGDNFWSIFSSKAPKGTHFRAFSAFAAKIAPDSCEKLIFEHFQLKT